MNLNVRFCDFCHVLLSLRRLAALRHVLPLRMITQCATLEAFRNHLVLTEKVMAPFYSAARVMAAELSEWSLLPFKGTLCIRYRCARSFLPTTHKHTNLRSPEAQEFRRRAIVQPGES